MPTPHGWVHIRLIGPGRRTGHVLRADDQLDPNAVGGGAFRKVDALVIIRDTAPDDVYSGCFELVEQGVLIGHAVTHGIDNVDAHH